MTLLKIFAIGGAVLIAALVYCPCIISGRQTRMEERRELEREQNKKSYADIFKAITNGELTTADEINRAFDIIEEQHIADIQEMKTKSKWWR